MDTPDPTRANAALWATYIEQQYGAALTPIGGVLASGLMGFAIANVYAAAWGNVIGQLFTSNFADMPAVVHDTDVEVTLSAPPEAALPPVEGQAPPRWLRVAMDELDEKDREREREDLLLLVPV